MALPKPATITELVALLEPRVEAKFRHDLSVAIDIVARTERIDADLREVTEEGLRVFAINGCEFIPWDEVHRIRWAALDTSPANWGCGVRLATETYAPAALARAA